MKTLLIFLLCLLIHSVVFASNEYDNAYCKDPVELKKWADLVEKNPDSDAIAALHALWVGLCAKVEVRHLTTYRANNIFENFRTALIDEIEIQERKSEPEPGST